jgi:hypothetical protein
MYFTKFCTFPTYILTTYGIRLHFSNDTYPLPSTGSYLDCVRLKKEEGLQDRFHPQLSHNGFSMDGARVGAGSHNLH